MTRMGWTYIDAILCVLLVLYAVVMVLAEVGL